MRRMLSGTTLYTKRMKFCQRPVTFDAARWLILTRSQELYDAGVTS